jgi:hypothetical protein
MSTVWAAWRRALGGKNHLGRPCSPVVLLYRNHTGHFAPSQNLGDYEHPVAGADEGVYGTVPCQDDADLAGNGVGRLRQWICEGW